MNVCSSALKDQTLSLSFVGDICLSMGVSDVMLAKGSHYPFEYIKALTKKSDLTLGNLECCFVDQQQYLENARLMCVDAVHAQGLKQHSGFDVFGLANNHSLDGGSQNLQFTMDLLQREKLDFFGAGMSKYHAEKPLIYTTKGKQIGIIGACDITALNAGNHSSGIAAWSEKRLKRQIKALVLKVDLVVVVLHGDLEFTRYPQPSRVSLSRKLVDYGAHLVIQHHPHSVQGLEYYKSGLIAYSLGNCIFQVENNHYQQDHPQANQGMLLEVEVDFTSGKPQLTHTSQPFKIDNEHRPAPMEEEEKRQWLLDYSQLCDELNNNAKLQDMWRLRCRREAKRRFGDLYWSFRRYQFKTIASELKHMLFSAEERKWLWGFMRSLFS